MNIRKKAAVWIRKTYRRARMYLASHKKLTMFLSHGGLHLGVLFVLLILIGVMSVNLIIASRKTVMIFDMALEDSCGNYELRQLSVVLEPKIRHYPDVDEDYVFKIRGYFEKRSPLMKGEHLNDTTLSNIPKLFQGRSQFTDSIRWDYSLTRSYIDNLAEKLSDEETGEVFILPDGFQGNKTAEDYIKKRTQYLIDSLTCEGKRIYGSITEREFLKFTSSFFKRNGEIEFYDSVPSEKSLCYTNSNSTALSFVFFNLKGEDVDNSFQKITKDKNSFTVINKWQDIDWMSHTFPTDLTDNLGSPYLNMWLKIHSPVYELSENSVVDLDLTPADNKTLYEIKEVYPTPSKISVNRIKYKGKEAVEQILNEGGVYVAAEDVTKAYHKERMFLVISVLLGTAIAFALDIIIKLIYKWRKLE